MEKSASSMVDEWEKKVKDSGSHAELEVGDYMIHVTADIIAFTAFGSNYEKGEFQQVVLINRMGQRDRKRFSAIPGYMIRFGGSKISLVVVLQWFHFDLSPNYCHAPHHKVTMKPKYKVPMILESL
ncbi:unnamed protein product [Sphagnum troendelagicum]|uniref:Uncharacterized protein n=1 Tax=Sphagnum troendelagicum TaxID=128251 RepID=A0ABP0U774_9BRYO